MQIVGQRDLEKGSLWSHRLLAIGHIDENRLPAFMLSEMKQLWIGYMSGFYWSEVHVGKAINEECNETGRILVYIASM